MIQSINQPIIRGEFIAVHSVNHAPGGEWQFLSTSRRTAYMNMPAKQFLIVGGPCNSKVIVLPHDASDPYEFKEHDLDMGRYFDLQEGYVPLECKIHMYHHEQIDTMWFLRHSSITRHEALGLVFNSYAKKVK